MSSINHQFRVSQGGSLMIRVGARGTPNKVINAGTLISKDDLLEICSGDEKKTSYLIEACLKDGRLEAVNDLATALPDELTDQVPGVSTKLLRQDEMSAPTAGGGSRLAPEDLLDMSLDALNNVADQILGDRDSNYSDRDVAIAELSELLS